MILLRQMHAVFEHKPRARALQTCIVYTPEKKGRDTQRTFVQRFKYDEGH